MSLTVIATIMATLLIVTVATAFWRCSHPYRMRYTRCARRRGRVGIFRSTQRH
ncbi:hypothetical protein [Cupriavidus sp. RAF12]|uniref:hypothetical protein n=1 Tax=Cupriavidus sp. RAF12 TaxID=3233050 RepID=UPI003F93F1E5